MPLPNSSALAKEYLIQISPEAYAKKQELLSGSSIGEHTRHFTEFFQCLIAQVEEGLDINYDRRLRNQLIQTNPEFALQQIEEIQVQLNASDFTDGLKVNHHLCCGIEEDQDSILTTLERELLYNVEHTIHHLAIIKIGLKCLKPAIIVSDDFGVAKSTIEFRNQNVKSFVEKN